MNRYKKLLLPIFLLLAFNCQGQQKDSIAKDSVSNRMVVRLQDTGGVKKRIPDSGKVNQSQASNSLGRARQDSSDTPGREDTLKNAPLSLNSSDSARAFPPTHLNDSLSVTGKALSGLHWVNLNTKPEFFVSTEKGFEGKETFFYVMCALLLLLGLFKKFYNQYFSNIFRVYFNTSLRQSQLSEQLLQARLPSFMLNIYFVIIAGIFVWLLFSRAEGTVIQKPLYLLQVCIGVVAVVYLIKYCFLKFVGWVSGIGEATDYYIFIIFLVNKLLALLLLPYIILLAFGKEEWMGIIETLALLSAGVLLASRYIKSYAVAGHKLSVKPFHFLLFIAGAELIPILLIYKIAVDYLVR